jgi:hypothetical protein
MRGKAVLHLTAHHWEIIIEIVSKSVYSSNGKGFERNRKEYYDEVELSRALEDRLTPLAEYGKKKRGTTYHVYTYASLKEVSIGFPTTFTRPLLSFVICICKLQTSLREFSLMRHITE